jgi:hypothetical protein
MIKEIFVIKKGTALYFSYADWRPKFSANLDDAKQFDSYDGAEKFLGGDEDAVKWFGKGFYQIEKLFVITNENE